MKSFTIKNRPELPAVIVQGIDARDAVNYLLFVTGDMRWVSHEKVKGPITEVFIQNGSTAEMSVVQVQECE